MQLSLAPGNESLFTLTPLLADGKTPSLATLSNIVNAVAGPFVVKASTKPNSAILQNPATTPLGATDTLTSTALATETDGVTTETITGIVSLTSAVSVGPAASLGFTFAAPVPIGTNV